MVILYILKSSTLLWILIATNLTTFQTDSFKNHTYIHNYKVNNSGVFYEDYKFIINELDINPNHIIINNNNNIIDIIFSLPRNITKNNVY